MTGSLAHDVSKLLRLEREARDIGPEATRRDTLRLWQHKRDLYFRVARACRAEGDLAGATEANRAAGHAVTMVHRVAEIGVCSLCGALESVDWNGVGNDRDQWHCRNCGRSWTTPQGIKPTEI